MAYALPKPRSEQQIPTSPPSSKLSNHSTKGQQRLGGKRHSQRSLSLGGWVKNFLPSHRPERGGTIRDLGYWELMDTKLEDEQGPQHRAASTHRSRRSQTGDSDLLTRWNTPKDLPQFEPSDGAFPSSQDLPSRANRASSFSDRKWSWIPGDIRRETLSIPKIREARESKVRGLKLFDETDSGSWASATAEKRLSQTRRAIETKKEIRRQRKDLKESGDYLGVQGINPETGELDVISPSKSETTAESQERNGKVTTLQQILSNAYVKDNEAVHHGESDGMKPSSQNEKERAHLGRIYPGIKWRRHSKQWSSAQEPRLSPVAQSSKSATPISDMANAPGPTTGQLVDLNIGEDDVFRELDDQTTPQTSGGTSKTSLTVVHTPHRLSHAAMTPAAVELFENGIEFNGESSIGKGRKDRIGAGRTEENLDGSFLGAKPLGSPESQGNSSKVMSARSIKDIPSFKSLLATLDSQFQKNHFLQDTTTTLNLRKVGYESLKTSKSSNAIGEKAQVPIIERDSQFTSRGSPLQKLSAKIFPQSAKSRQKSKQTTLVNSKGTSLGNMPKLTTNLEEVAPMTNSSQKDPEQPAAPLASLIELVPKETLDSKEKIQREMSVLRCEVDKVDKVAINRTGSLVGDEKKDQGWNNWAKDVVQRMVEKSEGVKDEPASTCITTTTGFDQKMSASIQKQDQVTQESDPRLSSQSFSESTSTEVDIEMTSCQTNSAQNTSPNLKPVEVQETAFISTLITKKEASGVLVPKQRQNLGYPGAHNTSPTSTSTMELQKADLAAKESGPGIAMICRNERSITEQERVVHPERCAIQGPVVAKQDEELLESTGQSMFHMEDSETELMMGYPGSYPQHPDANDDIASHFNSLVMGTGPDNLTQQYLKTHQKGVLVFCKESFGILQSLLQKYFQLFMVPFILPGPRLQRGTEKSGTTLNVIVTLALGFPGVCITAWAFS